MQYFFDWLKKQSTINKKKLMPYMRIIWYFIQISPCIGSKSILKLTELKELAKDIADQ